MRDCLLIATFFLSFAAHAVAPIVNPPSGASAYVTNGGSAGVGTSVPITYTILGGIAGDGSNCVQSDHRLTCNTCDNPVCATAPLCACNTNQIYNDLAVSIPLTLPTGITTGNAIATGGGTTTGGTLMPTVTSNNNGAFIDFQWKYICGLMDGKGTGSTSDCNAVASGATAIVTIYIDQNHSNTLDAGDSEGVQVTFKLIRPGTGYDVFGITGGSQDGIGDFIPFPGDEQVYLTTVDGTDNFPTLGYGGTAQKIRVYTSDQNMTDAAPGRGLTPKDIALDSKGTFRQSDTVDGLVNGQPYVFRVALVDEANNVVQFFPGDQTQTGTPGGNVNCDTQTPPVVDYKRVGTGCPYAAKPDQILGLLSKDMNCFIATAAYGSSLAPKIDVFREFRFKILLRHDWGRAFVKAYYNFGPKAALFIYDKPVIRAVTRAFLWPLYLYAWMSLKIGFGFASMLTLLILTSLIALPWFGMRRYYRSL